VRVNRLLGNREQMIGSVLLGNNLINILASALVTRCWSRPSTADGRRLATILMTYWCWFSPSVAQDPGDSAARRRGALAVCAHRGCGLSVQPGGQDRPGLRARHASAVRLNVDVETGTAEATRRSAAL